MSSSSANHKKRRSILWDATLSLAIFIAFSVLVSLYYIQDDRLVFALLIGAIGIGHLVKALVKIEEGSSNETTSNNDQ